MKVLRKKVGEPWEVAEIENDLSALQHEVGGYIEAVTLCTDAALIVDEEGLLKEKEYNTNLAGIHIVGTALIVGVDGDEFCDVDTTLINFLGGK